MSVGKQLNDEFQLYVYLAMVSIAINLEYQSLHRDRGKRQQRHRMAYWVMERFEILSCFKYSRGTDGLAKLRSDIVKEKSSE